MSSIMHREIDRLKKRILSEGAMVEDLIAKAISSLMNRDTNLARSVIALDKEIDLHEVEIEEECLKILALHQPVANDLRFVITVLKMNNDLERMGDLAVNIAKRTIFISTHQPVEVGLDFPKMAAVAQEMVKWSLDALVNADAALARKILENDDELDDMRQKYTDLINEEIRDKPEHTQYLLKLSSVARHLERLGDMATNVAEDVIYMVEGAIVRHLNIKAQEV